MFFFRPFISYGEVKTMTASDDHRVRAFMWRERAAGAAGKSRADALSISNAYETLADHADQNSSDRRGVFISGTLTRRQEVPRRGGDGG